MRSWGWDHHGRPGGGQGGQHRLRTRPRHGAPVRLVRRGHEDREDMRTETAVLYINTILLVRNKLLIQTERPCKI